MDDHLNFKIAYFNKYLIRYSCFMELDDRPNIEKTTRRYL